MKLGENDTHNSVEEGWLADVGEANDAGFEAHAEPWARGVEPAPLPMEEERRRAMRRRKRRRTRGAPKP